MTRPAETSVWDRLVESAHVWHLSPEAVCSETLRRRCLSWLTPQERARRERFATEPLRHNYLTARVLCRWALSRYAGVLPREWQFFEREHGKPAVEAPPEFNSLRFNLTHADGFVACIVTRAGEVGLDVENTWRQIDIAAVAGQFLSVPERECLSKLPPHRQAARFFEYWVLKEAYLKALGTGLSQPPDEFTIEWHDDGHPAPLNGWQLQLHRPTPRHVAATAVPLQADGSPLNITWQEADIFACG